MISFKEYLQEATTNNHNIKQSWTASAGSDITELVTLLNAHCKSGLESVAKGSILYRADRKFGGKKWITIDSSTGTRTSRDTNNVYQLMLETSEHFKHIPQRSKSLICSTDFSTAYNYADNAKDIFVVFPFDGTSVAYTPGKDDFIKINVPSVLNPGKFDLEDISSSIGDVLSRVGIERDGDGHKYTNANIIDAKLSKISIHKLVNSFDNQMMTNVFKDSIWMVDEEDEKQLFKPSNITAAGKKIIDIFEKMPVDKRFTTMSSIMLNPGNLNILTKKAGGMFEKSSECWFSGKAIMVSFPTLNSILEEMNDQKMPIDKSVWDIIR
jgi:hypothetical protein